MDKQKIRVGFYIDGFNAYHRIKSYHERCGRNYRWLDYRKFVRQFVRDGQELSEVCFFTAYYQLWDGGRKSRHEAYIRALRKRGVRVVSGYFSKKSGGVEEKQTDVNIALAMVLDAMDDKYDRCWLLSSDNDFAPVLQAVREKFGKEAGLMIPPVVPAPPHDREASVRSDALKAAATKDSATGLPLLIRARFAQHFAGCSLPRVMEDAQETIVMPEQYETF